MSPKCHEPQAEHEISFSVSKHIDGTRLLEPLCSCFRGLVLQRLGFVYLTCADHAAKALTWGPDVAAQQRRMVPAPRLQMKDAQGEQRDVLQGLLMLQDADVSLPLSPGGAPCRLSR